MLLLNCFVLCLEQTGGEKGRKDDSGLAQMVQTLSQPQKEELKSLHEGNYFYCLMRGLSLEGA